MYITGGHGSAVARSGEAGGVKSGGCLGGGVCVGVMSTGTGAHYNVNMRVWKVLFLNWEAAGGAGFKYIDDMMRRFEFKNDLHMSVYGEGSIGRNLTRLKCNRYQFGLILNSEVNMFINTKSEVNSLDTSFFFASLCYKLN